MNDVNRDAKVSRAVITVPAGGTVPLHIVTEFISVKQSTGPLRFNGEGIDATLSQGQSIRARRISRIEVSNDTGADITATIVFGTGGQFTDNTLAGEVSILGTVKVSKSTSSLNNSDITMTGPGGMSLRAAAPTRREALICALAANTATIRVGLASNVNATRGIELAPGQTLTLATTEALYGYNPSATPQNVAILELLD